MLLPFRARPGDGIVWITGASSGIGRFVALEFARRGFSVAASARRESALAELVGEAEAGGRIHAYPVDIGNHDEVRATVARIEAEHGGISLAFLNAGTYYPAGVIDLDIDQFRSIIDLNIMGTVHCIAAVLPGMFARGRGQLGINASVAGYGGLPRSLAYSASKAALINLAQSLTFDCAPRGVSVQVINPGFIKTPLTDENDFPMPFLMPVEDAAQRVCDGFARGGFEITFPRRFAYLLKALNLLPYGLYLRLVAAATRGV
jgi:NAD(P)-dependent dehydrogenase (short-subunit alcohol dehydrogenase family)